MKTIRQIRLERLSTIAAQNVANSENEILKLYESFEDGIIQANKARRIFAGLCTAFIIDLKRYNAIKIAIDPDCTVENPKFWENHYCSIFA